LRVKIDGYPNSFKQMDLSTANMTSKHENKR
jgi:hypothetical protein